MSKVMITHPDPWIGIPESFPYAERWGTARSWAQELVTVLADELGSPSSSEEAAMIDYLEALADSRESRHASRIYILITGWNAVVHVVDMVIVPTEGLDGISLKEFAGASDTSTVEMPLVEEFRSESGLDGLMCTRYINHEAFGGILARIDYVFAVPQGFLRLYAAVVDLIAFQRLLPPLAELAKTVRIDD